MSFPKLLSMDENTDDGSKETKEQDDIEQFSMGDCIVPLTDI